MNNPQIDLLARLTVGPLWDGNVASKDARDQLFKAGYVDRIAGWNFLTANGIVVCASLGILNT